MPTGGGKRAGVMAGRATGGLAGITQENVLASQEKIRNLRDEYIKKETERNNLVGQLKSKRFAYMQQSVNALKSFMANALLSKIVANEDYDVEQEIAPHLSKIKPPVSWHRRQGDFGAFRDTEQLRENAKILQDGLVEFRELRNKDDVSQQEINQKASDLINKYTLYYVLLNQASPRVKPLLDDDIGTLIGSYFTSIYMNDDEQEYESALNDHQLFNSKFTQIMDGANTFASELPSEDVLREGIEKISSTMSALQNSLNTLNDTIQPSIDEIDERMNAIQKELSALEQQERDRVLNVAPRTMSNRYEGNPLFDDSLYSDDAKKHSDVADTVVNAMGSSTRELMRALQLDPWNDVDLQILGDLLGIVAPSKDATGVLTSIITTRNQNSIDAPYQISVDNVFTEGEKSFSSRKTISFYPKTRVIDIMNDALFQKNLSGMGHSRLMRQVAASMEIARRAGVTVKMTTNATSNNGGSMVGYHIWPRMAYTFPMMNEMQDILSEIGFPVYSTVEGFLTDYSKSSAPSDSPYAKFDGMDPVELWPLLVDFLVKDGLESDDSISETGEIVIYPETINDVSKSTGLLMMQEYNELLRSRKSQKSYTNKKYRKYADSIGFSIEELNLMDEAWRNIAKSKKTLGQRVKHLRGRHDQLDHAWNRGMGGGAGAAGGVATGGLSKMMKYRETRAALLDMVRTGDMTRDDAREQLRAMRDTLGDMSPTRREEFAAGRATGGIAAVTQENVLENQGELQRDMFADIPVQQFRSGRATQAKPQDAMIFGVMSLIRRSASQGVYRREGVETVAGVVIQQYSREEQLDILKRISELDANNYQVDEEGDYLKNERRLRVASQYHDVWKAIGVYGHPDARLFAYQLAKQKTQNQVINNISNQFFSKMPDIVSRYEIDLLDDFANAFANGVEDSFSDDFDGTRKTINNQLDEIMSIIEDTEYDIRRKISQLKEQKGKLEADTSMPDSQKYAKIADILDAIDAEVDNIDRLKQDIQDTKKMQEFIDVSDDDNYIMTHLENNSLDWLLAGVNQSESIQEQARWMFYKIAGIHAAGVGEFSGYEDMVTPTLAAHMQNLLGRVGANTDYDIQGMPSFFFKALKDVEPHPELVKYMNIVYEATQEKYRNEKTSTVTLYRGRRPESPPRGIPMEPWSTSKFIAQGFGSIDTEMKMPVEYIFYDHEQGGLLSGEYEYLVLGWAYWNWKWAKEQAKKK
jgi:hypothetical protein